jgi:hypothetical protein
MSMYGEEDVNFEEDADQPEESNNRTFLLAIGAIGVLVFILLLCIGGYFLFTKVLGGGGAANISAQQTQEAAATQDINAQIAAGLTSTSIAATALASSLPPTETPTPSPTPVVALPTDTPDQGTPDPATATIAAALTHAAAITQTVVLTSTGIPTAGPAALPNSGFADEVGLPMLVGLTLALLLVIFVARRLRGAPVRNR